MANPNTSANALAYTGIDPTQQPSFRSFNRTPNANDYISFNIGDQWRDISVNPPNIYILKSVSGNSAIWQLLGSGLAEFPVGVLTGDGSTSLLSSTVTQHAPIIGDAQNKVASTAALTNGQLLIGSTGAAPVPAEISGGTGISVVVGAGSITASLNSPVTVATGGTGATTLTGVLTGNGTGALTGSTVTQHAPIIGDAQNKVASTAALTNGQLLIGSTGAAPVPGGISGGTGISVVVGAGTITASLSSPVTVATGGTGATTLTGVLTGNGTGALTGSAITENSILRGGASNAVAEVTASANGVLITNNSSVPSLLPNGTAGQILTANTGAPPSWKTSGVQVVSASITTQVSTDALIPLDATIPTSTEGIELLTVTITPKLATSSIMVFFTGVAFQSAQATGIVTLFRDSGTNSIATTVSSRTSATINNGTSVNLHHVEAAGSTTATTYKIRFGKVSGAGTIFFNANGEFGSSSGTRLTAMEVPA